MNEPIEKWVTDVHIVKIICDGRTQGSSTWKNLSTVQACHSDWHDVFLKQKIQFQWTIFQGIILLLGLIAVHGNLFVIILTVHMCLFLWENSQWFCLHYTVL